MRLRSLVIILGSATLVLVILRYGGIKYAEYAITSLLVIAIVGWAALRPPAALLGMVIWVPLQVPILAYAYRQGAPISVVRHLGYLKELWAIGLLIAAVRGARRHAHQRLDKIDRFIVAFALISTVYLLLPLIQSSALGGLSWAARLNAWRLDTLFLIVFASVRRLELEPQVVRRLQVSALLVAMVLAGFAIWEASSQTNFNDFLVKTLDYPSYRADIFNNPYPNPFYVLIPDSIGNTSFIRAGSLFNDPLTLGFFLLIPLGIGLERIGGRKLSRLALVATGLTLTGIVLSLTISAALGAVIVALGAIQLGAMRRSRGLLRLIILMIAGALIVAPAAGHSALLGRVQGIFTGSQDQDSQGHVTSSQGALNELLANPVGRGLGANTSTSTVYNTSNGITSEDSYLETGNELGLAAMVMYAGALLSLLFELRRRAKETTRQATLAGAMWITGLGLSIGAFFLQTWYELPVALVYWTLAGVGLSHARNGPDQE